MKIKQYAAVYLVIFFALFSGDIKDSISKQKFCHNDHTEMFFTHCVFSGDLQGMISV